MRTTSKSDSRLSAEGRSPEWGDESPLGVSGVDGASAPAGADVGTDSVVSTADELSCSKVYVLKKCRVLCYILRDNATLRGRSSKMAGTARRRASKRDSETRRAIEGRKKEIGACERCAATLNLHGHHRHPHASHPELRADKSNIEILCSDCHAGQHPVMARFIRRPVPPRVPVVCTECGKTRLVTPSTLFWRGTKFCSRRCYYDARHREARGGTIPLPCHRCEKITYRHPSTVGREFCSQKCSIEAITKPKRTIICEECGKEHLVTRPPGARKNPRFCSLKCRNTALAKAGRLAMAAKMALKYGTCA